MDAVHRRTIDCRGRSKIPGMSAMVPAATVILAPRSSSVSTTVSYTSCFMCPQRMKSRHVKSGDLDGQATGPPRPVLTAMLKCVSKQTSELTTCTQSSFECQYTFSASDLDTTAYVSLQRPYVPYRNIFVLMFSTSCLN